ncbi:hypothetical protein GB928_008195 [Shinella curvata]|uniref:DUF680 domain-containing protein n=1 Tax=Shinella curvata TaxID=1817964 RepID=A0ABT8XD55_9HYPH|nr:hypothetical protein [Shinella curvata]MCJ8054138.1 hypothetical protein [Shinella curvata]MDO6121160.1 hypothetical protein [Shinella curvata]
MNKLAITIAALSLSAGAAFAENPNFGRTDVQQSAVDRTTTASVNNGATQGAVDYIDPAANRYGDGAPRN